MGFSSTCLTLRAWERIGGTAPTTMYRQNATTEGRGSNTLFTLVVVVAVLYLARVVFIPLALAVLVSFLLAPLVTRLKHIGLGRLPATLIVVLLAFTAAAVIGMIMASQMSDVVRKVPEYQQNIRTKLESIRNSGGSVVTRISHVVQNISEELTPQNKELSKSTGGQEPVPVEIRRNAFSPLDAVRTVLGSLLSILLVAAIVVVLTIFMLVQQEDLRDRLLRLAGENRVNVTTRVLDDAARRVSRYLLAQLGVNVIYGILIGFALLLARVPDPLLWGMMAALLRYIPYLGIWIAGLTPALLAFAVEPGWIKGPIVVGCYFGVDLLMYNFVEPLLYGNSTGLSPLAILFAAVFWTWLWGPVGLLLATPLTVCVVVLGRHIPKLEFLEIMLSDEQVLTPQARLYQRLLAKDLDDAKLIARDFLKHHSLEELYDLVLVPVLTLSENARHQGSLDEGRRKYVFSGIRAIVQDCNPEGPARLTEGKEGPPEPDKPTEANPDLAPPGAHGPVYCIPAKNEADAIAALMLAHLLARRGVSATGISTGEISSGNWPHEKEAGPRVACISSVPPSSLAQLRGLSGRVHRQLEGVPLVTAHLTEHEEEEPQPEMPGPLASSLTDALTEILALLPQRIPV